MQLVFKFMSTPARRFCPVSITNDALIVNNSRTHCLQSAISKVNIINGISETIFSKVKKVKAIEASLKTGFSGSADTRITKSQVLKEDLLNSLSCGTLGDTSLYHRQQLPLKLDYNKKMCIPEYWARAVILVRTNSLAPGISGVSSLTIQASGDLEISP